MNKLILLPKLALVAIKKNRITYFPYILAGMLSVFTFFVFSSIFFNDLMKKLPHSGYLSVLMGLGMFLLGLILIPFLLYVNSFLIKRRKLELGLYNILGLEKKHMAIMMLFETIFVFIVVLAGGVMFGLVFSKLLFLLLLNLTNLPVDTEFTFSINAFRITFFYFVGVFSLNLIVNMAQVFKSNPNDLMKGSKSGEKAPKRLWVSFLLGVFFLATGYYIAIVAKLDTNIFLYFLLAVMLVVLGTHYFFKAGILALLRILKSNKKFYYNKINFTTVSGMLYRMKKSAASLANICIFSTMTIITLLCTASLWLGTASILDFQYPFDIELKYNKTLDSSSAAVKFEELSVKNNVSIKDKMEYSYVGAGVLKDENRFIKSSDSDPYYKIESIRLVTLKEYNKMEMSNEELLDNEVIVYCTGVDLDYKNITFGRSEYSVKKELNEAVFDKKASANSYDTIYYFIVKDENTVKSILNDVAPGKTTTYSVSFNLEGEEHNKKEFANSLSGWVNEQKGISSFENGIYGREDTVSMNGGLLFIGIFFGIIFAMCLILIMYYKQITEGYDDRDNFKIMQKVGMSDTEVKGTIKQQILMVFLIPLVFAIFHTMAGFGMTTELLGTLFLFNRTLVVIVGVVVTCVFALIYGVSYILTSRVYYNIVKQMN